MAQRGGKRPGAGRKPGKVGAAKRALSEMAKDHAKAALWTLAKIQADDAAPAAARVSAATAILDRAYGKPAQSLELTGKDGGPIEHANVQSDAERFTSSILSLAAREGEGEGARETQH